MNDSPRVLAILFGLIGDTMMRVPALRALRRHWPNMHLTGICDPVTAPVLQVNPLFDDVLVWPRKEKTVLAEMRRIRALKARGFDVALDFYFGSRSPWTAWGSGAKRRIGPARHWMARRLLTDPLPFPMPADAHMVDRFGALVTPLGAAAPQREWEFPLHAAVHARARNLVQVESDDIVVVAGAGDESKRLDDAIESEMVAALAAARRVWIVRDQRDPARGSDLLSLDGVEALPPLGLAELGAVFADCALVITPDSGPLHIALATAPRVMTWYLSTDPVVHHADRPGHAWLYEEVCQYQPCDTRMKHLCELECRESIPVGRLLTTANSLLEAPGWTAPILPARDPLA